MGRAPRVRRSNRFYSGAWREARQNRIAVAEGSREVVKAQLQNTIRQILLDSKTHLLMSSSPRQPQPRTGKS